MTEVEEIIRALRCCADSYDCEHCPRFIDEYPGQGNLYIGLCNDALMNEAALKLEELTEKNTERKN